MKKPTRWILFSLAFCFYMLSSHGYIENPDAEVEYQTARAIALKGRFYIDPLEGPIQERIINAQGGTGFGTVKGKDGRFYSWFGIGHALMEIPFLLVGKVFSSIFPEIEKEYSKQPHSLEEFSPGIKGEEYFPRLFVSLAHPLAMAGNVVLVFSIGELLGLSSFGAIISTLVFAFCTMAWPFSRESVSDGPATLFFLASLASTIKWSRRDGGKKAIAMAGIWTGIFVSTRIMLVLCVFPIGLYISYIMLKRKKAGDFIYFIVPLAVFAALLMFFNWVRFGNPLESGYGEQADKAYFSYPVYVGLFYLLFSLGKGFIPFNIPVFQLLFLVKAK